MISQLYVEWFAEITGMSPEQRWIPALFPVALAYIFGCRKNPGDNGQFSGRPILSIDQQPLPRKDRSIPTITNLKSNKAYSTGEISFSGNWATSLTVVRGHHDRRW